MIVRQDPLVFTGSVRDNVDPFNLSTDEEIVKVLHYLGLYAAYSDFIKTRQIGRIEKHINALNKKIPTPNKLFEDPVHYVHKRLKKVGKWCMNKSKHKVSHTVANSTNATGVDVFIKSRKLRIVKIVIKFSIVLRQIKSELKRRKRARYEQQLIVNDLRLIAHTRLAD